MWDISPASLGNKVDLPETKEEFRSYYNFVDGGDNSPGYEINPKTNAPYEPQLVPRSDYAAVVAEFWADGPDSETPPGHWFTILNYVNDHPQLEKKYLGEGAELSDLEWDVKAYLMLGGAMHDCAISAWSSKGYYDYPRPISSIRYLADKGQSSDPSLPSYHPNGIMLVPGSIELVGADDPLASDNPSTIGRIQMKAFISGVDTLFTEADLWFPYQAVNFVNPPFAGYVSGHSTFSRAAAEILTRFTGDAFFPGGLGEFHFEAYDYLDFGLPGPTKDMSLQWATYIDAANQSALSRIWGGIHPPIDDIPGRKIGVKVADQAFRKADALFGAPLSTTNDIQDDLDAMNVYPNPARLDGSVRISLRENAIVDHIEIVSSDGLTSIVQYDAYDRRGSLDIDLNNYVFSAGLYTVSAIDNQGHRLATKKIVIIE